MAAFNHYAKIKRILASEPDGWRIILINKPTSAKILGVRFVTLITITVLFVLMGIRSLTANSKISID